jgi:hypothetical protein
VPPKWASCANCGTSYPGMSTETCSDRCTRELAAKRAGGRSVAQPPARYSQTPNRRGKSKGPGPVPKAKPKTQPRGWCSTIALLPPVVGVAAVLVKICRRR